jgi:hypothetical protein
LTEAASIALSPRTVRVTRAVRGIELYFPPLRLPQVALALGLFGLIAALVPAAAAAALWPLALADAAGMLAAVFLAAIIGPFMIFGVAFVGLAGYMLFNALTVRANAESITSTRTLCGIVVRRAQLASSAISRIQAEIPTRYQNLFDREPVYQLVAIDASGNRLVVAESLRGGSQMEAVKGLIEDAVSANGRPR